MQQTAQIDFSLEADEVTQSIEVASDAAMLNTSDAVVGTVIDQARIVHLPLDGRNYLQLVALSPNVSAGFSTPGEVAGRQGGDRAAQNFSLSGMRGIWSNYSLDGISNTDVNFNLFVMRPSVDALQEFKVGMGTARAEVVRTGGVSAGAGELGRGCSRQLMRPSTAWVENRESSKLGSPNLGKCLCLCFVETESNDPTFIR